MVNANMRFQKGEKKKSETCRVFFKKLCLYMRFCDQSSIQRLLLTIFTSLLSDFSFPLMSNLQHVSMGKSLWGPPVRSLAIVFIGGLILALSCIAEFQGFSWLYSSGSLPLLSCPELGIGFTRDYFVDQGLYCQVSVSNWKMDAKAFLDVFGYDDLYNYRCKVPYFDYTGENIDKFGPFSAKNPIICELSHPCSEAKMCTEDDPDSGVPQSIACPRGSAEVHIAGINPNTTNLYVNLSPESGFYIQWDLYNDAHFAEYCDSDFLLPVGKMIAVRGWLVSLLLLGVLWLIVDYICILILGRSSKCALSVDMAVFAENENNLNHLWSSNPVLRSGGVSGMKSRTVLCSNRDDTPTYKMSMCVDPKRAFASNVWLEKVSAYYERKNLVYVVGFAQVFLRMCGWLLFIVAIGVFVGWVYLELSPSDLSNPHSIADSVIDGYGSIFKAESTWIILPFLFLDELWDICVFVLAVGTSVKWGKTTIFAQVQVLSNEHSSEDTEEISSIFSNDSCVVEGEDSAALLIPNGVAAVFVLDESRIAKATFLSNLKSVIDVFGIDRVFVLQHGNTTEPMDDTVLICQREISLGIQYVFVPEADKLAAVYWFSKYYIPLFQLHHQQDECDEISHLLLVDQSVSLFRGFNIPNQFVHSPPAENDEPSVTVGCVCFASEKNDLDWKFQTAESIFLSDRSSLGDSEISSQTVVMWHRNSLELAAFNLLPSTRAFGGDFGALGHALLRNSTTLDQRVIKFAPHSPVKIRQEGFLDSFVARARSQRKVLSALVSLISPSSILNKNRIASKMFDLKKILSSIFDTIRLPVFFSSAMRDPIGLAAIVLLYIILVYVKAGVLSYCIIRSSNDRPKFGNILLYPWIHFFGYILILRPLSICAAFNWAMHDHQPGQSISTREDFDENMPPVLPYPEAPWFTVWQPPTKKVSNVQLV